MKDIHHFLCFFLIVDHRIYFKIQRKAADIHVRRPIAEHPEIINAHRRERIAKGSGTTDFDALYDLLGGLYVVPISSSFPLKVVTFLKLLRSGTAPALAAALFRRDRRTEPERHIMALSRCAPLSTAELVRCAERDISAAVGSQQTLALLYGDQETTSDNIVSEMRTAVCCQAVTAAVANLYLRKQVIFERACA